MDEPEIPAGPPHLQHREFTDLILEELERAERTYYCKGWRWGLIDGMLVGALLTFFAFMLGLA